MIHSALISISLGLFQGMNPILASAIVPGWGEAIQGKKAEARTFVMVEGALWVSYLSFNYFGKKIDHSARTFAVQHAGANPANTEARYFDALEDYFSSDEYNLEVERLASRLYPDDPQKQQDYIETNGYFDEDEWKWDSRENKDYYWQQRRSSRESLRRATFITGFMVINRIVSVINVAVFSEQTKIGVDIDAGTIDIYYKF